MRKEYFFGAAHVYVQDADAGPEQMRQRLQAALRAAAEQDVDFVLTGDYNKNQTETSTSTQDTHEKYPFRGKSQ